MATRFYFAVPVDGGEPPPEKPDISTALSASWNKTNQVTQTIQMIPGRGYALTSPLSGVGTNVSTKQASEGVTTNPYTMVMRKFISPPLAAQTITGNFQGQFLAYESASAADFCIACVVRVFSADGSTERGTLLSFFPGSLSNELAITTPTNTYAPPSQALTSLAVQQGDRIVIELGVKSFAATNNTAYIRVTGGYANDLPVNNTTTGSYNSWFEFSNTLTFVEGVKIYHVDAAVEYVEDSSIKIQNVAATLWGSKPATGLGHNDFSKDPACIQLWTLDNTVVPAIGTGNWTCSSGPYFTPYNAIRGSYSNYFQRNGVSSTAGAAAITEASLPANFPLNAADTTKNASFCLCASVTAFYHGYRTCIIGKHSNNKYGWGLFVSGANLLEVYLASNTTAYTLFTTDIAIRRGRWHHITITIDGKTNKILTVYCYDMDYGIMSSWSSAIGFEVFTTSGADIVTNLFLNHSANSIYPNGSAAISEFACFNKVLSASEALAIAQGVFNYAPYHRMFPIPSGNISYQNQSTKRQFPNRV